MNIAYIITGLNYGGAERMLLSVYHGLVSRGHKVIIIILNPKADQMLPLYAEIGAKVISFDIKSRKHRAINFIKLIFYMARGKFDVVHCHLIHAILIGLILRFVISMRVVVTVHSTNEGGGIFSHITQLTLHCFHQVIFISERVREAFCGKNLLKNSLILHNFTDFESNRYIRKLGNHNGEQISFCTISRLDKIKNIEAIIFSFSLFYAQSKTSFLDIYGAGEAEASLKQLISTLRLTNCVTLKGPVKSANEVLDSYKFFVTACVEEGFGLSLLEAASHGLFCIAVDNHPHRFILEESNYCYLFNQNDKDFIGSAFMHYLTCSETNPSDKYLTRLKDLFGFESYIDKLLDVYARASSISLNRARH